MIQMSMHINQIHFLKIISSFLKSITVEALPFLEPSSTTKSTSTFILPFVFPP